MASTFLNPTPRLITWKPPLSVKVGPGQFMKAPEPAGLVHDVGPGLQVEVVRVGQHGLGAQLGQVLGQHRLDRGLGADGDEGRGLDRAVRRADHPGATEPVWAAAYAG